MARTTRPRLCITLDHDRISLQSSDVIRSWCVLAGYLDFSLAAKSARGCSSLDVTGHLPVNSSFPVSFTVAMRGNDYAGHCFPRNIREFVALGPALLLYTYCLCISKEAYMRVHAFQLNPSYPSVPPPCSQHVSLDLKTSILVSHGLRFSNHSSQDRHNMQFALPEPEEGDDIQALLKNIPACRRCRQNHRRCDPSLPSCRNCVKAGHKECIFFDPILGEDVERRFVLRRTSPDATTLIPRLH